MRPAMTIDYGPSTFLKHPSQRNAEIFWVAEMGSSKVICIADIPFIADVPHPKS